MDRTTPEASNQKTVAESSQFLVECEKRNRKSGFYGKVILEHNYQAGVIVDSFETVIARKKVITK